MDQDFHPLTLPLLTQMARNVRQRDEDSEGRFWIADHMASLVDIARQSLPQAQQSIDARYVVSGGANLFTLTSSIIVPDGIEFVAGAKHGEEYYAYHVEENAHRALPTDSARTLIVVDDGWRLGTTMRDQAERARASGYDLERTFALHVFGDTSFEWSPPEEQYAVGIAHENPALLPIQDMVAYFNDKDGFVERASALLAQELTTQLVD